MEPDDGQSPSWRLRFDTKISITGLIAIGAVLAGMITTTIKVSGYVIQQGDKLEAYHESRDREMVTISARIDALQREHDTAIAAVTRQIEAVVNDDHRAIDGVTQQLIQINSRLDSILRQQRGDASAPDQTTAVR